MMRVVYNENNNINVKFVFTGCSTLGFGDFNSSSDLNNNQSLDSSGKVPVTFTYQPLTGGKHQVYIAGDFNNWSENATMMNEDDGIYSVTLFLKNGKYSYKFIVDGKWISDDNAKDFVEDGYGGQNSIVFVGNKNDIDALRKVNFIYKPSKIVKEVYLVGSMNDWNIKTNKMVETSKGVYEISLLLKPGEYEYKFNEDGMFYVTDQNAKDFADDGFGGKNSVLVVDESFDKVTIKKGDGIFLDYGLATNQSLENINPLSPLSIEFKAKAHFNDVENISLLIKKNQDSQIYKMEKVAEDGSYEYFQKIISLSSADDEFDYCFIYQDGSERLYLLNEMFSMQNDENKYFHYSKSLVQPFFYSRLG